MELDHQEAEIQVCTYTAPPQRSGPYPHDGDQNVDHSQWRCISFRRSFVGRKIDFYEEPQSIVDAYMKYGLIPNAFRLGKAGLEKLGEFSSGFTRKGYDLGFRK